VRPIHECSLYTSVYGDYSNWFEPRSISEPVPFQTGSGIGSKNNRRNNDTIAMSPKTVEATDKRTNQNTGLEEVQDSLRGESVVHIVWLSK